MGWQDDREAATGGWLQPQPPPAKPTRQTGQLRPLVVYLPQETLPRAGAIPFDYTGTGLVSQLFDVFQAMVQFSVPEQFNGVIEALAGGSITPADNDELMLELFVNTVPRTDELGLNRGGALITRPTLSSDLAHPTPFFVPVYAGETVIFAVATSALAQLLPTLSIRRPVRGRVVGRFWPKNQGSLEL